MTMDKEKLKHCILFFLERINNVHMGRKKLMKLLYYVDFDHYETFGKPVTGAVYKKLEHGPVPVNVAGVIEDMIKKGELRQVLVRRGPYEQHRLVTISAKFDPTKFSGDELETLQKVATDWENANGGEIEAQSHVEAPWQATPFGKVIDYELALYRKPTEREPVDEVLTKSKRFKAYVQSLP